MFLAATVPRGPAETAFTLIPSLPRSRARYRVTDCSADLATPIQSYAGHAWLLSKSRVTKDPPPALRSRGSSPTASVLKENAEVVKAVAALSAGVSRNAPPRASAGANAMACSAPSTTPHLESSSAARASMCVESLMSSSRTSGVLGRRRATRSVSRIPRSKPVRTMSAPSSRAIRAVCQAMESSVSTPVITRRLPSSNIDPPLQTTAHRLRRVTPATLPEAP